MIERSRAYTMERGGRCNRVRGGEDLEIPGPRGVYSDESRAGKIVTLCLYVGYKRERRLYTIWGYSVV